jgi:hypothetical protein
MQKKKSQEIHFKQLKNIHADMANIMNTFDYNRINRNIWSEKCLTIKDVIATPLGSNEIFIIHVILLCFGISYINYKIQE